MESTWVTLARDYDERQSAELALVLESRAIEHRRIRGVHGFEVQVPEYEYRRAREEIEGYARENAGRRRPASDSVAPVGRGWPGVWVYAAVLMLVAVCVKQSVFGLDWLDAGRLEAGPLRHGEWWRAVTALTLHAGLEHLSGNLVFGGFFGYFAARHMGTGVAWAAIVAAGVLGNVLNALVVSPGHRSVGASTAVFAALGLLAAFTWRRSLADGMSMRARIAPLVAGVMLLGWLGIGGENTDIGAHVFGFIVGVVFGVTLARVELRTHPVAQLAFGAAAAALVLAAWAWGLAAAG